jgi:16S rRNA (guanine527-N7)-methyltransferase
MMKAWFEQEVSVTDIQKMQFEKYLECLLEYNQHTNLTSITEENDVYIKHFYDSIWVMTKFDFLQIRTIADMGTGAGFPGIPLKIMFPHLHLTLIDSNQKKITFLNQLVDKLELKNVTFMKERAEVVAKQYISHFDVVVTRAMSQLNHLIEFSIPMIKRKGKLLAYKGATATSEMLDSKSTLNVLKSDITHVYETTLPNDYGTRAIIEITKQKHVVGYPRPYTTIIKKGL